MIPRVAFVRKGFRRDTSCQAGHKQKVEQQSGVFGQPAWVHQPYAYWTSSWNFEDELGTAVCDRCVCDGLRAGTMELTNPGAVDEYLDDCPGVAGGYAPLAQVRAAFADWGGIPLTLLERAIEAAGRRGTLPALAAQLLAAMSSQPPPPPAQGAGAAPDGTVAGKRARSGSGFVGQAAGTGPADRPPPAPGVVVVAQGAEVGA